MAGTFITTGTYSNLTRLELEQLRRGDFTSGGKALTVGDSALAPEGVVGKGNVNAEPFYTGPAVNLDDVYPITPLPRPGPGLLSSTMTDGLISEFARWYGPTLLFDSFVSGRAISGTQWNDPTLAVDYVSMGIVAGDLLLIKETNLAFPNLNQNTVATITVVAPNTLTCGNIFNPNTPGAAFQFGALTKYSYMIVRPRAIQLFAVPGSGPVGEEQTFLAVIAGSVLHNMLSPTVDQINVDRVQNVIRPNAGLDATVDRADNVFTQAASRLTLEASLLSLGYRMVLYPDDGTGTGPDLTNPITTLSPIIDPSIPAADQRMSFDYKAGTVRFSCAPKLGGDIKVAGGVNATTGRLNLYAVFWAIDLTLTKGDARGLYAPRSTNALALAAGRARFDPGGTYDLPSWRVGSTPSGNDMFVKAIGDTEGFLALPTERPFMPLRFRNSTEFGTLEVTAPGAFQGPRYFSYRQTEHQWRFRSATSNWDGNFGETDSEMFVADKTEFTVSDLGSPANAAANLNPDTSYGSFYGARNHWPLTTYLGRLLYKTPHGTVHLKKGRYYLQNELVIPPGTTLEGEGSGTRLIYRVFDSPPSTTSARGRAVLKVGPNTTWGVYDASAYADDVLPYKTAIFPTEFPFAPAGRIEGVDTVWNPVRRCWAVVFAHVGSNSIFFNEILEDGTTRWPGLGVNIKATVNPLFVDNGVDHQNHAGGHYPRIAYQEHDNEYAVVWVEEVTIGFTGGRVAVRWFQVEPTTDPQITTGWSITFAATVFPPSLYTFSDHPSVAVENFSTTFGSHVTCITFWSYDRDVAGYPTASAVSRRYYQFSALVLSTDSVSANGNVVISSTDVAADESGGFMSVWTYRDHSLYRDINGTVAAAAPDSWLTDPGVADWSAKGVVPGSKVHMLVSPGFPTTQQGLSGVVTQASVADPQLHIKYEGGAAFLPDGPGVVWAVTPMSRIRGRRASLIAGAPSEAFTVDVPIVEPVDPGAGLFHLELKESDYVRISRGAASWCVVFQGFDSHCGYSYPNVQNFDNGQTFLGPTFSGIYLNDPQVYREHVSTCSVILKNDGNVIYPTQHSVLPGFYTGPVGPVTNPQLDGRLARDLEVSLKSLGTRTPITARPNYQTLFAGLRVPVNEAREVSPLNFSYRWTTAGMQACIPDVTWTGQDWVAVSPAKQVIHSHTGQYIINGANAWLSDAMFYFGDDGPGTDNFGWNLRRTIPSGSKIYFPVQPGIPVAQTVPIASIADEHTVNFTGFPLGVVPIGPRVEWMLVLEQPDAAGVKNQGFRIGSDGRLITSTDFVTWADQPRDIVSTVPREIELMRRPQAQGGNYPTQVAGDAAGQSADPLEPGSRRKANIGFRGVAPGRPKGMSFLQPLESPAAAIAWGENLYGLIDRIAENLGGLPRSQVEFYRQSFGPYNVTLRNFSIEATPRNALAIRSYAHVYTRHLAPVASCLSFATDGFRTVFAYPTARVFAPYKLVSGYNQITSFIGTVYTNAVGHDPIYMEGPALGRGDLSEWCTDISSEELVPTWVSDSAMRYAAPNVGPKVIWDGQRFALFWIERANRTSATPNIAFASVGYFLCMSYLPGGEDDNLQTGEMVDPYEFSGPGGSVTQFPLASVHISDGSGFPSANGKNTLAVCDVAFSGKVYAVVWAAGLSPDYNNSFATRGSSLGVTLFNMDSATPAYVNGGTGVNSSGGGTTYVIEQDAEGGTFQNPKIVWDGHRFMVFYEVVVPTSTSTPPSVPSLNSAVAYAVVPEDGLARPTQTKQISGKSLITGSNYTTGYPGTGGPFSTLPLGGFLAHSLGSPAATYTIPFPGSPFYSAKYTLIQLYGNEITPFLVASVATGITTVATNTFTAPGKNFYTLGVRAGDYLIITSGADIGVYVVNVILTATTLDVVGYLPAGFTGSGGCDYAITRFQQPQIQPGDMLVVQGVDNAGVMSAKSNGVYPIVNYDPKLHQLTIQGEFDAGDVDPRLVRTLRGEIRSGGLSDYDNGGNLESTRAGINPRSALVGPNNWATGATAASVSRLHGVAYNDVDDEFAVFASYADGTSVLYGFKPNTRAATPAVWLNYAPTEIVLGAGGVAWNGSHYLVVAPFFVTAGADLKVRVKLLNSRFSVESTIDLVNNFNIPGSLFGNSAGQLPGPGYGPAVNYGGKVAGVVQPWIYNTKVEWNSRLSRWLVAASVLWYDQATSSGNTYDNGGALGAFVPAGGANIVTWIGTTITLSGFSTTFQPGMKLLLIDATAAPFYIAGAVTILEVVGAGPTYNTLRVDAVNADVPAIVPGSAAAFVAVREDVLMWTLGQDAAGIHLEDADNVHIEDVVIGGGATDIEERWPNMGRPVWQAAGQTMGAPSNITFTGPFGQASLSRQPQYNHRFMTPAGKVNLPSYTNVTSSGHHPYGRTAPPGSGYRRDKLRNRQGGG